MVNGTLPVGADQGVHSLTDVPVFAQGPCQEMFGGECQLSFPYYAHSMAWSSITMERADLAV